jgi:hypothetical protein
MKKLFLLLTMLVCGAPLGAQMLETTSPLTALRANSSDRFTDTTGTQYKILYPETGRPVTTLKVLGSVNDKFYYAAITDTTSQMPAPIVTDPLAGLTMTTYSETLNGPFRVSASSPVLIERQWVDGSYRAIETNSGAKPLDVTIRAIKATNIQRDGIRVMNAGNILIEDFDLTMRAEPQTGTNLPEGIAIGGNNCAPINNVVIRNGKVSGFRMAEVQGVYTNGDGVATEGCVVNLTISNVRASNNSDGGFDLKGQHVVLNNLVAENNSRGFRNWSPDATATTLVSKNNGTALWMGKPDANGVPTKITIDRFIASSEVPAIVFRWERGALITVKSCDLTGMAPGSTLTKNDGSGAVVTLGEGCTLSK